MATLLLPITQTSFAATAGSGSCTQTYTTGGTGTPGVQVTESDGYCYIAFKNSGNTGTQATFQWTVPSGVTAADVLVVGGGGGGGSRHAGGGGAGALVEALNYSLSSQVDIAVGAGGVGAAGDTVNSGGLGQPSTFKVNSNGLTALGGGAGVYGGTEINGGSGGGTGGPTAPGGLVTTQSQSTFNGDPLTGITFGNPGAAGASESDASQDFWAGGGGGGAGGSGSQPSQGGTPTGALTDRSAAVGGAGGAGKAVSWISESLAGNLTVGEVSGSSVYFSGGGGGGMGVDGSNGGPGGIGGGGDGTRITQINNDALPSTGGGGGGSGFDDGATGFSKNPPAGDGGSGVVIVRYAVPSATLTLDGGSSTSSGQYPVGQAPTITQPSINGLTLLGWAEQDGGDFLYKPDLSDFTMPTSGKTLYAVWNIGAPKAVSVSAGPISLSAQWTAPDRTGNLSITGYQLQTSLDGATWGSSIPVTGTSHRITGLLAGTSYYVRVRAVTAEGSGAWGYPWTEVLRVVNDKRDSSDNIQYASGFGLASGDALAQLNTKNALFSRIRYSMEFESGGVSSWVDVNFDDQVGSTTYTDSTTSETFDSLDRLKVPTVAAGQSFEIHGNVADLVVDSSDAALTGHGFDGRLEIWPWNYGAAKAPGFTAGSATTFDFNDTPSLDSDHGSFQVHNLSSEKTVLAWNLHRKGTTGSEVGIGNNATGNPDWTGSIKTLTSFELGIFANVPAVPTQGYSVAFDVNGGSGTVSNVTGTPGAPITLPPGPEKDGFSFAGWATASSGGQIVGQAGDSYAPYVSDGLVLRYEFANPNSYLGSGSAITDISPGLRSGLSGTVNASIAGSPSFGSLPGSLDIDPNEYLLTGNLGGSSGRLGTTKTDISVFTWFYPQSANGVVVSDLGQPTINASWHDSHIEMVGGKLKFNVWPYNVATPGSLETVNSLPLEAWYYVGYSYFSSTQRFEAYVYDSSGQRLPLSDSGFLVKNRERSADQYFGIASTDSTNLGSGAYGDFKIGSFQIFSEGLSPEEVSRNFGVDCSQYFASANCPAPTLYAQWTSSTNVVTLDENGGSSVSDTSFLTGGSFSEPASPTKTDKIFGGWSTLETSNQGDIANRITSWPYSPTATSGITLYAIWLSVAPPLNVVAIAGDQQVVLTWDPPSTVLSEAPTGYRVEYSTNGTNSWTTATDSLGSGARTYTATALTNDTDYYFRVAALYNGARGDYGYPWTKIFETTTKNRVDGQIVYSDGFGLAGRESLLSRTDFSRVRYELRAAYTSGGTQYFVDSNFDANLTNNNTQDSPANPGYPNLFRLQVPVPTGGNDSQFVIHGNISDLSVQSNVDEVTQGIGQTGRLEIWPWDYQTDVPPGIFGGSPSGETYDSADNPSGGSTYGSFQLHTFVEASTETAFAWNRHADVADRVEIGFGNNTLYGTHSDWTFAGAPGNGMSSRSEFVYRSYANLSVTPTISSYDVTYAAGDLGTGSSQTVTKTHGIDLPLANSATANGYFIRSGYEVTGWSTNSDGSTVDYALGANYTLNADLTLYPVWKLASIEALHDTWVQSGTSANSNYGSNASLLLKNAGNSTANSYNRVAYTSFSFDPSFNWSGGALEVHVSGNSDGAQNNGYNITYTTFNVDIYGANDASWNENTLTFNLANGSNQDWALNTGVWPWNPDAGTYLGTISIPTNSSTIGQKFALSNAELDAFLNADSDGAVTFYMRRSDVDNQANLSFASSENTTYPGPSLVVAGSGYQYTIAYDINGGTGILPASGTYTQGGSSYTIAATTGIVPPAGKLISGWNTKKDGTGTDYAAAASYSSASSLTLYAKYVSLPKVIFKSNYTGGPSDITQTMAADTATGLRQNSFTRTGYTFAGWDTASAGSGTDYADGADITISADEELFAQWTGNTYTVLFDYVGATGNTPASDTYTVGSGTPITLPNAPTPPQGYTFGGWYVSPLYTGSALSATYEPTSNLTIYAKWNAINYTLDYLSTNGSGSAPADQTNLNIGQSVVIQANTGLTRTGYAFEGWVLDPANGAETPKNTGDTLVLSSAVLNNFLVGTTIPLHPKWAAETYTVKFNANGATAGSVPADDSFTTGGQNIDLPGAGTLAKTGHTFGGWSLTPTGAAGSDSFSTTANVTLYAVWTIKSISVTYQKGLASSTDPGVTVPNVATSNYGSLLTLGSPSAVSIDVLGSDSVPDHQFFGWSDGTTTYQPGETIRLGESNLTLTAQWLKVYQVRYALNGGTLAVGDFTHDTECGTSPEWVCVPGTIRANNAPSRDGYNFLGWKDQAGVDIEAGAEFAVDSNTYLLYAQWQAINYSFSFLSRGGSNAIGTTQKTIGQLLTLPDPGTRAGYSLSGWFDGVTTYQPGSTFTVGSQSKEFEAIWTPDVYTLTYDWQGGRAIGSAEISDTYTFGSAAMSLPDGSGYSKDGYQFAGWSETASGSIVSSYKPDQSRVLYAIWVDGNYTLTYDAKGGDAGVALGTVGRGNSVTLPTPLRAGFVFNGWFDAPSGGNKIGAGGDSHNPGRSKTLYANWVQRSLFGVDLADLDVAATLTVGAGRSGGSITKNSAGTPAATVSVPDGSLPENTVVSARYFKDLSRQAALIEGDNNYIFSLLVSWITGSGDTATVPDTDPAKPITVTLTSSSIRAGQSIYQVIGNEVEFLGKAIVDGSVSVDLYEDPEIVVAATVPDAPTAVSATSGTSQATVSWTASAGNGGSPITGYTVTSNPGSLSCTTTGATSCVVSGLTEGVSYSFSVKASNSVGDSASSTPSQSISTLAMTYTATFDSNGGSAVASATFSAGAALSAPASPTRSGYRFEGWSTTLNDAATEVSFPYSTGDQNLTLFALWTQNQVRNDQSQDQSSGIPTPTPSPTPNPTPTPTPGGGTQAPPSQIGFVPKPPEQPVAQTGPVGNVAGSSEQVKIDADAANEKLVATGDGWQLELRADNQAGTTEQIGENLQLRLDMASTAEITGSGLRPNTVVEAWVFSEPRYLGTIPVGADGSFASELQLPNDLLPGQHTLQIATLNPDGNLVTLSIPIVVKGKVTIGTFKGFIAIYTLDLEGQRLSARVAGKWITQTPVARFKQKTYSRLVRFTGAGYDILVDVYINRKFFQRQETRTR